MPEQAPNKSALLIGINHYGSSRVEDLRGCVADVQTAETYLRDRAGLTNIVKLISPGASDHTADLPTSPTMKNVVDAFDRMAANAQPGDFVYIHYSGHGMRIPTRFRDFKANEIDEALALVGAEEGVADRKVDYLRDVELAYLLKRIADTGAVVTLVLDCCHSAGAVRGRNAIRGVTVPAAGLVDRPPIAPEATLRAAWRLSPGGDGRGASVMRHWMTSTKGIEFLAACRTDQKAQEVLQNSEERRGLMSVCLEDIIELSNDRLSQLSCDMMHNLVAQKVDTHAERDGPQDVIFGGLRSRSFFGTDRIEQRPATVTYTGKLPGGGTRIKLDVGKAHGVRKEERFALYPADREFRDIVSYNAQLAICKMTQVNDLDSVGSLIVDNAGDQREHQIQRGCKAVSVREILYSYVMSPSEVRVVPDIAGGVTERDAESVERRIRREGVLVNIAGAHEPFFEVRVEPSDNFTINFTPSTTTGAMATVKVRSVDNLLAYLAHLTIFYNLLHLCGSESDRGVSIEKIGLLPNGHDPPEPRKVDPKSPQPRVDGLRQLPMRSPAEIAAEDSIGIRVTNKGYKPVYIEVLDLEPSWKVSRIYPIDDEDAPIQLVPNESADFYITMTMPATVPDSVQPEPYDAIVVLGTPSNRTNFPVDILPQLNRSGTGEPSPVQREGDGRGGRGVASPKWFAQRVDVRVVPARED